MGDGDRSRSVPLLFNVSLERSYNLDGLTVDEKKLSRANTRLLECGNLLDDKKRKFGERCTTKINTTPLLSNVFNYELGMMKEKVDRTKKQCTMSGTPSSMGTSDNLFHDVNGDQSKKSPLSKCRRKRTMLASSTATSSPTERSPLSTISNICHLKSEMVKDVNQGIKKKNNPTTPDSTLSDVFKSGGSIPSVLMDRPKLEEVFGNTTQTLDFQMKESNFSNVENLEDIEYSTILDMRGDDDDCPSDNENEESVNWWSNEKEKSAVNVPSEYATLGAPNVKCSKCEAWMWKEERTNKHCTRGIPEFSICCGKGEIQLPKEKPTPSYMWQLLNDKV